MTTPSLSVIVEDDLTCPVCFELLNDPNTPKLLDCPHVCCAVCIQKMIEGGRRIVECPECRHVTRIPEEGVTAMKTNLRVRSRAEKHEEQIKKTPATAAMCPEHNITIDFYCKKCNVVGCRLCMVYKHKGPHHDVDQVENVQKEQMQYMEGMFNLADKEIEESKQSVKDLTALQNEMKRSLNTHQENIKKQVELTIKKVKEEGQTLIDNCRKNEQPRIDRFQQEIYHLQTQIDTAIGVVTTAKSAIETIEKHNYVVEHDNVVQSVRSSLGKDTKGKVNRNIAIGMTKYVYSKPLNMSGHLGKTLQLKELECKLINEFGEFISVNSIASTPCDLLVVSDFYGKQVFIYRQLNDGKYKRQSTLSLSSKNTTEKPWGVAVTPEGKYLVARETHVEVYSTSGKYEGTLNFRQGDGKGNENLRAHGIKVMPDGRVVVAHWDMLMLTILSPEGTLLDRLHTSVDPSRIAVMPHGYIAVGDFNTDKIYVIDVDSGKEVKAFDIPGPLGLCYQEQTDCLLVGTCRELTDSGEPKPGTSVIRQYCSTTGSLLGCIAEGLCNPQDMTFASKNMLAVADVQTVKTYKVV